MAQQSLYNAYKNKVIEQNDEFIEMYKTQSEEIEKMKSRLKVEGRSEEEIGDSLHDRKIEHILAHVKIIKRNRAELSKNFPDFFTEE